MARKTKYTPETVRKVVEAVKMGATYELAAGYAGISEALFYEWLKGKVEFLEAVKAAEGVAAMVWLAKIEKAASEGAWQAAAWKLERRYPHAYGRNVTQMEVTGKDGGPIEVNDARAALTARLATLAHAPGPRPPDSGAE